MKKLLGIAVASATMATSAMAAVTTNMENPLFIPKAGEFASKTGAGVMYKKADHTDALKIKDHDGAEEFPVWRFTEDFGYGITDRLSTYVLLGWTQNDDIDRKGMHRGRLGLNYRAIETLDNIAWDVYGEAYLSGVSPMKGSVTLTNGNVDFKYDNFSNGRWGAVLGTKVGKTWSKFTASLFAEYLQTFGNHNNKIKIDQSAAVAGPLTFGMVGFPDEISVDLKSTKEITVGTNAFYQINDNWSFGGGFRFVEHTDNGVKSIHTKLNAPQAPATAAHQQAVVDKLLSETKNMHDGWNEYILSASVANQISDSVQIALFGEYTFDDSHKNSQNGTDVKAEVGVRANVRF
ncbi:MAG: hypothetical protein J5611_02465 [Alphaproteobacteria bacterium]|nr:hypothetical protein [Alphaproteobacteria bacterium]